MGRCKRRALAVLKTQKNRKIKINKFSHSDSLLVSDNYISFEIEIIISCIPFKLVAVLSMQVNLILPVSRPIP